MRRALLVVALPIVVAACGRSNPVAPSTASSLASPAAAAADVTPSSRAARATRDFCDDMNLEVTATTDIASSLMAGTVSGTNGGGTVEGVATVSFGQLIALRNGQSEAAQQEHSFSTADGSFTLAGSGRLMPANGRPGLLRINERLPVTAGTRIFLNATGDLRLEGELDTSSGRVAYTMRGRVCRTGEPAPDPVD